MKTEAKAKVVASVWGGRICSIPCRASCFVSVNLLLVKKKSEPAPQHACIGILGVVKGHGSIL